MALSLCAEGVSLGPDDGYLEVYHALSSALDLPRPDGGHTPLPVRGVWGLWTGGLTLVFDGKEAVPATWEGLQTLVGGTPLKPLVDRFDVFLDHLSLAELSVTLGFDPPSVAELVLSVAFERWTVAGGILVMDPVQVGFSLRDPLGDPDPEFWVLGTAHLFDDAFTMRVGALIPSWELAGELVKPVPIGSLLTHLHVPLPDPVAVPGLDGLVCARLNIHANPISGMYGGSAWFTSDWKLRVADTLTVSFDSLSLAVRAQVDEGPGAPASVHNALIDGRIHVGEVSVEARYSLGGHLDIHAGPVEEGPLADIPLSALLDRLLTDFELDFGTLPSVDLVKPELGVMYADPRLELWAATDVVAGELGVARVEVRAYDDQALGFQITLAMPGDWRLSRLGEDFAELDFLGIDDTTLQIAATPTPGETTALEADLATTLKLQGGHGLDTLGQILSYAGTQVDLALAAHVPLTDPLGSTLDARLQAQELWLIPQVLRFDDLRLDIALRPLTLTLATDFQLRFSDDDAVELSGGMTLTDDSVSLFLVAVATKEHPLVDWPDPLGVARLTLRGIGLELTVEEPEGLAVTLSGQFRIGDPDDPAYPPVELAAAAKVAWEVGEDPPFPAGLYTEKVSAQPIRLGQLLQELVTPDGFPGDPGLYDEVLQLFDGISIDAFAMVIAVEGDWTIPEFNRTFPQGFSFIGQFDCYGITADLRLQIATSPSAHHSAPGLEGSAEISPITLTVDGHTVVSVTGYQGQGDPLLRVSTWSSPYLKVSGELKLLETIQADIDAVFDTTKGLYGFHFCYALESAVDGQITIHCELDGYTAFDARSDFAYHVHKTVALTVSTRWGDLEMGSLTVSGDGDASFHVSASVAEGLSWTVTLSLTYDGHDLSIPSITSTAYVSGLSDMMGQLVDQIESLPWDWFSSHTGGDIGALIRLFEQGLLEIFRTGEADISHICKILYDQYHRDLEEAVADLRALGFQAWEAVVMAWEAYEPAADTLVAAVTSAFGASPEVLQQIIDGFAKVDYDWREIYPMLTGMGYPLDWYLERLRTAYNLSFDVLGPYLEPFLGQDTVIDVLIDYAKYPANKVKEWAEDFWDWLPDFPLPDWDWLPFLPPPGLDTSGGAPTPLRSETGVGRARMETLLNEKAWADPEFKAKLLSDDPAVVRQAIGDFFGEPVPADMGITVLQERPGLYWHVVPRLDRAHEGLQPPKLWPRPRFQRRVNWFAKQDPAFLDRFAQGGAEAREALRQVTHLVLPDDLDVRVVREAEGSYYVVLRDPSHEQGWQGPYLLRFGAGDKVTVQPSDALALPSWTLAVGVRPEATALQGDGFRPILRIGEDGPALGLVAGALALELTVSGARRRVLPNQATTMALQAGRLSTVVAALEDGGVTLAVDGVIVAIERVEGTPTTSRGPVCLGGEADAPFLGDIARASIFDGPVDRVGLWRHLRPSRELVEPPEGAVANWPLVRGFGDQLLDVSGGGHHGTLQGTTWVRADPAI